MRQLNFRMRICYIFKNICLDGMLIWSNRFALVQVFTIFNGLIAYRMRAYYAWVYNIIRMLPAVSSKWAIMFRPEIPLAYHHCCQISGVGLWFSIKIGKRFYLLTFTYLLLCCMLIDCNLTTCRRSNQIID